MSARDFIAGVFLLAAAFGLPMWAPVISEVLK